MMATKDQERKALEQIRKIVAGLGRNSYIGTAFEGCFEIAEQNIEDDAACSMKGWKDLAERNEREWKEAAAKLKENWRGALKRAEEAENLYNATQKTADSWCAKYHEADDMAKENWNRFREQEDKVAALELENMKLKAKLYDMMTATA